MEKLKNKMVLIIDDDFRNTFTLKSSHEMLNMKTAIADNGEQAISALHNDTKPDVILPDMMMPLMDRYGILKQDNSSNQIAVIAVMARTMKGDREKCIEAGAWDYVSKPIDMKSLVHKTAK